MKKFFLLATTALMVTGVAFADNGKGKKCKKSASSCCKKSEKKCCKKDKETKETKETTVKI